MSQEGCDYCVGCDTCQKCDTGCQGTCDTSEAFCKSNQCSENGFLFSKCVASGEIICDNSNHFSRDTWNEAISKINSVFSEGRSSANGRKGCTNPTNANSYKISSNSTDTHITADEFSRVASAANYNNSNVKSEAVIYGSYFSSLANAVANLSYKNWQCDTCNSSCDVECDKCQNCDTGCQGVEHAGCSDYCCDCCDNNCCDNNTPPPSGNKPK